MKRNNRRNFIASSGLKFKQKVGKGINKVTTTNCYYNHFLNMIKNELRRLISANSFSLHGLKYALQNERAFRLETFLSFFLIPLSFILGETFVEMAILFIVVVSVLIAELFNSAIEITIDRIGTEHNELSGLAKDLGSAAVWVSAILAGTVWFLKLVDLIFL